MYFDADARLLYLEHRCGYAQRVCPIPLRLFWGLLRSHLLRFFSEFCDTGLFLCITNNITAFSVYWQYPAESYHDILAFLNLLIQMFHLHLALQ
ncbi:hypothetical protein CW304_25770 [Bacillus sp. UFRGS-B20]|nr:hypothetical protein CW304_25770 [Bacillus sp. UFRGS-B20]